MSSGAEPNLGKEDVKPGDLERVAAEKEVYYERWLAYAALGVPSAYFLLNLGIALYDNEPRRSSFVGGGAVVMGTSIACHAGARTAYHARGKLAARSPWWHWAAAGVLGLGGAALLARAQR